MYFKFYPVILGCLVGALSSTLADEQTIADLQPGEKVEIRFDSQACFGGTSVTFRLLKTDKFMAEFIGENSSAKAPVELSAQNVVDLDLLLAYYRGLDSPGFCTTRDTIGFLWSGPTIKPFIQTYVDATCHAPPEGRAVILHLAGVVSNSKAEPSNKPVNPTANRHGPGAR